MESYGSIDERSAATPPKFGRRIIAAVAAVALVVGASAALTVNRLAGANLFMCPMIWAPVCGENGKTYGNACQAQGARMPFTDGECSPDAQAQTTPCTREFMPVCGSDGVEYVNKCYADTAGTTYTKGPCTKPCTREYRPVCGLDMVQYPNACLAGNAGVGWTVGPCRRVDTPPAVIPCDTIYDPVCGSDDMTYPNASDSRPRGSLREAAQRPHGLHGPVPEVPQRGPYDDVLQVLSGVLGSHP